MKKIGILCFTVFVFGLTLSVTGQKRKYRAGFKGSIDSSVGFYFDDKKLETGEEQDAFGTNTFLNLGYEIGRFRFGLEYDIFEPPMIGFSSMLKGNKLMQGFVEYAAPRLEIRLGSFFEQLGSGLLFRAYEDRAMAVNTSLMGGNIRWSPADWISFKGFAGRPRKFMKYASSDVYGIDVEFSVGGLFFPETETVFVLGGSGVLRDARTSSDNENAPRCVRGFSGRMNFSKDIFSLGVEYTAKSRQQMRTVDYGYLKRKGEALLINTGLDYAGFGISAEYRILRFMDFHMDDLTDEESLNLNYMPSLTRQHKYALLSLYPHKVEDVGETGGQFDVFGEIPWSSGSPLAFSLNGAMYRKLKAKDEEGEYYFMKTTGDLQFAELGLELSRRWNKKLKTAMVVSWQKKREFSRLGFGSMLMNTEIVVADMLYKLARRISLRVEAQHAWSDSHDDRAWAYGIAELGIVPNWMFYVSDMYNYKTAGKSLHYFSLGGSFTWKTIRAAVAYGRNRAGMQCSGGICRYVPQHTGLTLNLTILM